MLEVLRAAKIMELEVDKNVLIQKAQKSWNDFRGRKVIKTMDEAEIDFTIVCNVDNAGNEWVTPNIAQQLNKMVANIANKYPDRLMALAGVDPRRPEALDMLKQCFEEFGMKGLKYHADNGYLPLFIQIT